MIFTEALTVHDDALAAIRAQADRLPLTLTRPQRAAIRAHVDDVRSSLRAIAAELDGADGLADVDHLDPDDDGASAVAVLGSLFSVSAKAATFLETISERS